MLIGKWYGHQRKFSEPQNQYCNDCNYPFDDCCFIFISSISTKEYPFSLSETNIWTWYSRYIYDLANLFYHGFFNVFITRPCMQMLRDVCRMYQYIGPMTNQGGVFWCVRQFWAQFYFKCDFSAPKYSQTFIKNSGDSWHVKSHSWRRMKRFEP